MWMQRWSHSTRAGQATIPDSRRPLTSSKSARAGRRSSAAAGTVFHGGLLRNFRVEPVPLPSVWARAFR